MGAMTKEDYFSLLNDLNKKFLTIKIKDSGLFRLPHLKELDE